MSLTRRYLSTLTAAVAGAMALTACGGGSGSTTPETGAGGATQAVASSADAACDAAGNEGGQFTYWASTDPDVFAKEIQPFRDKYPDIKVSFTSLRPADMTQRVEAEVGAGRALDVDVISGDLPSFETLFSDGLIRDVDWAPLGIPEALLLDVQNVSVVRIYRIALGLGYNAKVTDSQKLPSTWQGLIDPQWRGRVVVDPRGIYLSGLALAWGKDQSISWFGDLLKTDEPMVVQGATASLQKVISGEALLTTSSHDAEVREQKSSGAPVDIKYLDVVPTQDYYSLVLKGARHPNAAACFLSWFAGDEGAAQQLKYEFKSNDSKPPGISGNTKIVSIENQEQAQLATDVATRFAEMIAAR